MSGARPDGPVPYARSPRPVPHRIVAGPHRVPVGRTAPCSFALAAIFPRKSHPPAVPRFSGWGSMYRRPVISGRNTRARMRGSRIGPGMGCPVGGAYLGTAVRGHQGAAAIPPSCKNRYRAIVMMAPEKGRRMAVVTMSQLLEAGVHFGHQTRRWNPKMKRYILTDRNSIYIIDLRKTVADIDRTYDFVKETVAHGGNILFVGTKKQAQEAVKEQAERTGMPYVNERWLGGMLTNFQTVAKRIERLKELEQMDFEDVAGSGLTKKELLMLSREKDKLEKTLGGLRDMHRLPSAVWVVDTNKEHLAVSEANKLNIPVVAILDTNCDPDEVAYPIPGNDDAIGAVGLLTRVIGDAVAEGLLARGAGKNATEDAMPEWEREVLAAGEATEEAPMAEEAAPAVEAEAEAAPAEAEATESEENKSEEADAQA